MQRKITTLFLDVGNVLLTNGWDRKMRKQAAELFNLDYEEMNERHHLTFDAFEHGRMSLQDYLDRVVFYEPRSFSREQFLRFMYAQSQPVPEMIQFVRDLKARYQLKLATVSNEGRELTAYRMEHFGFCEFIDVFVASSFVHARKPEPAIYRMALDLTQARPEQSIYIDDRAMFVEVAESFGLNGILHTGYDSTRDALASYGLELPATAAAVA
ncbi:MAG TPA: HAD family phosphatase [Phycisphaerae bacterium]|nr:HAD family phosphatase [Phycisphaerae bacterium]HOM51295.1 HAD family phosphatase [Phycisphaerae bacterium]HOQ84906.1 HAD family phosphatase [Phycisphaerae bacterium]HPU28585.1 HAD family phosphatase [Phycisphaerae bacterium]HPZ99251.1 HAD family phosphatase [Phycisphaerae bacterium]